MSCIFLSCICRAFFTYGTPRIMDQLVASTHKLEMLDKVIKGNATTSPTCWGITIGGDDISVVTHSPQISCQNNGVV